MLYTFPSGGIDSKKHLNSQEAAEMELSEEAQLKGGFWIPLMPANHNGISELKWGTNKFIPYLVLDAEHDCNPKPRDQEGTLKLTHRKYSDYFTSFNQ
jgi:8-oxo-dGTP pyrophosphatase MutT (NUDIX family)